MWGCNCSSSRAVCHIRRDERRLRLLEQHILPEEPASEPANSSDDVEDGKTGKNIYIYTHMHSVPHTHTQGREEEKSGC